MHNTLRDILEFSHYNVGLFDHLPFYCWEQEGGIIVCDPATFCVFFLILCNGVNRVKVQTELVFTIKPKKRKDWSLFFIYLLSYKLSYAIKGFIVSIIILLYTQSVVQHAISYSSTHIKYPS